MNPLTQFKKILTLPFLIAPALLAVASYGQTPITSVPFTINTSGNYVVTAELVYSASSGNAITVNAHHVTIDLNGHYLFCATANNSAKAIFASNKANIRIRNGEIAGFLHGVELDYPGTGPNLNVGSAVDTVGFYKTDTGVLFDQTIGAVVRNCIFIGPGTAGVEFFSGSGNRAVNNVANGLTFGFFSGGADYFESNYADHCTNGIFATSVETKFRFNTTTNCTTGVTGGTSEFANDF